MRLFFDPFSEMSTPFVSFEQATDYLDEACVKLNVRHLSYWCVSFVEGVPDQVSWIATYPPEYMNHYMSNYTPIGDPAFEASMSGPVVSDWVDVINTSSIQKIHDIASKYGIAKHGLSIPMRDGRNEVLFSANVDCDDRDWPSARITLANTIHMMAYYFHRRITPLIRDRNATPSSMAA